MTTANQDITIQFTAHNTEATPALRTFATNKLQRLQRHSNRIVRISVNFEVNKLRHMVKVTVHLPKSDVHATANSEDMYKSVDQVLDKLVDQLEKHKGKHSTH